MIPSAVPPKKTFFPSIAHSHNNGSHPQSVLTVFLFPFLLSLFLLFHAPRFCVGEAEWCPSHMMVSLKGREWEKKGRLAKAEAVGRCIRSDWRCRLSEKQIETITELPTNVRSPTISMPLDLPRCCHGKAHIRIRFSLFLSSSLC